MTALISDADELKRLKLDGLRTHGTVLIATNISDLELEARDAADVKYQSDVGDRG